MSSGERKPLSFDERHEALLKKIDSFAAHPLIAGNEDMKDTLDSFRNNAEMVATTSELSAAEAYVARLERELQGN